MSNIFLEPVFLPSELALLDKRFDPFAKSDKIVTEDCHEKDATFSSYKSDEIVKMKKAFLLKNINSIYGH
jgi:hypothetical protein